MDNEFKLLNIVFDVVFKFDNCGVWPFTNPNKVVDVVLILFILKIEFEDNEFKLLNIVVDVVFKVW